MIRFPISSFCLLVAISMALPACRPAAEPQSAEGPSVADMAVAPAEAPEPAPVVAAQAMPPGTADFDPASVPESTATLPPFPFFAIPDGMQSTFDDKDKLANFDRQYFLAGGKAVAVEGKIFHDRFNLGGGERSYTELEFLRNYEKAVLALGGKKINDSQYTPEVIAAAGGRDALEQTNYGAGLLPDYRHDSYLLRKAGKEYWIDVSTGSIPLHGYVVVLERDGMKQSLKLLDAAAMKQAIDKDGRIALHINFDTDKATLRAEAQPTIDEIHKLLQGDPALNLSIEGHTDNTGAVTHNLTLSAARARSVLDALVGLGIDPGRLQSKGFGQERPSADNSSETGRAENRRVELVRIPAG